MQNPRVFSRASLLGVLLALAVLLASPLDLPLLRGPIPSAGGPGPAAPPTAGTPAASPTASAPDDETGIDPEAVPARGTPIEPSQQTPASAPDAPFAVIDETAGTVRWDPCTPIPFVARRTAGPPNGFELIQEALQRTADASGLTFTFAGFTTKLPDQWRSEATTERPGMWIGWAFGDEVPDVGTEADPRLGIGGPRWTAGSGEILDGIVVIKSDTSLAHSFGPGQTYGNVLLHELGHAVGLGHSESTSDIMYPLLSPDTPASWGPGDLAGLYALGSAQGCLMN